ncbi:aminoacyl-tRNA deacylase [Lactobacillus sp. DCY120]|uniref:Cys-tRNA(Pro)/Cys-tRNA(Cys) deacylase n=1 Tax=Bombilactobacillus apium TaxID=2675299 RepID=A0A850RAL5_9LACO|nr:aminoacyl-tRNA deacylase [Bombilactobacillus apium]NVY95858.1 aminoacyl-tRNA deacylase [Bombilactobacillus apium]
MSKKQKHLSKTLVEKILDKEKIPYQALEFPTELQGDVYQITTASTPAPIYKTLVLTGTQTGPLVGVLPLQAHLSYKLLAQLSGNKKVTMVPLKKLQATSGFIHGANSPIGIREQHNYPIFFDNQALKDQKIAISAGKVGRSVLVAASDIASLVQGKFGDFAVYNNENK